jgi:hypothetical protein
MGGYFLQDTPQADFERLMMQAPNSDWNDGEGKEKEDAGTKTTIQRDGT